MIIHESPVRTVTRLTVKCDTAHIFFDYFQFIKRTKHHVIALNQYHFEREEKNEY